MPYQDMKAQVQDHPYYKKASLFPGTSVAHAIQHPSRQHMVWGTEQVMAIPRHGYSIVHSRATRLVKGLENKSYL